MFQQYAETHNVIEHVRRVAPIARFISAFSVARCSRIDEDDRIDVIA